MNQQSGSANSPNQYGTPPVLSVAQFVGVPVNIGTSKPKRKRGVRKFSVEKAGFTFRNMWVYDVQRGRHCTMCRRAIIPGEPTLRYLDEGKKFNNGGTKFTQKIEKAICKECALEGLNRLIAELSRPVNTTTQQKYYDRMSKKAPKESQW